MIGIRSAPLWSHVPSAVNGGKNELTIVSGLRIAANLRVNHELFPGLSLIDRPVQLFDPSLGAISRYNAIGISRVHKHSVLASQLIVNVDRSCTVFGVRKGTLFLAEVPLRHIRRDMKGVHDGTVVQVVIDGQGIDTVGDHLKFVIFHL